MFVENVGQSDASARFQARRGDTTIYLADSVLWFTILERAGEGAETRKGVNLKLSFPSANPHPRLEPFDRLDTHISFFRGSDPDNWHTDVPAWGGVRYVDLYPGVDLEITGKGGRWAWRLVVRDSQFATSDVRLHIEGADGLALDGAHLRLATAVGDFALPLLQAVAADGAPLNLPAVQPEIKGAQVIAPFFLPSPSLSPQGAEDLLYSAYLGGTGQDWGNDITVDGEGDAYVVGETSSDDFPTTTGVFSDTLVGGRDAFVAKVHPVGEGLNDLVYATYLGGSAGDRASGVAVDGAGNAYVTGWSNTEFPITPGSFGLGAASGAFVTKLNPTGSALLYSGCIAGTNADGHDIALDGDGRAYVSGSVAEGFPVTAGAYDEDYNGGGSDPFVAIVSSDGLTLTYATYLGGSGAECEGWGRGCTLALDGDDNVYVTGGTESTDFPTTAGAYDRDCGTDGACNGGYRDAFVLKLNPAGGGGSDLVYATYLGGSSLENTSGIAVDGEGSAYVTGEVHSDDFPTTAGVLAPDHNGAYWDAFVTKLNAAGSDLTYSSYLGGSGHDHGWDIAVDGDGLAYAIGQTGSDEFPVTADAYDSTIAHADTNAYVAVVSTDAVTLTYATYLGGDSVECEKSCAIAVDAAGNVYATGETNSDDFPTSEGAYDTSYNDGTDAFMVRLPTLPPYQIYLPLVLRDF